MELGHAVTLSETNSGGFVPICECAWIGSVAEFYRGDGAETLLTGRRRELTQDAARAEHAQHVHNERERIADEHALAMKAHAAYVQKVAPTVRRIGRWGAG